MKRFSLLVAALASVASLLFIAQSALAVNSVAYKASKCNAGDYTIPGVPSGATNCLHLSSDSKAYVLTTAPSNGSCPDKKVDDRAPVSGIFIQSGSTKKCFYSVNNQISFNGATGNGQDAPPPLTVDSTDKTTTLNQNATKTNCSDGSGGTIKIATPGLNLDCTGGKNPIYALAQFIVNWAIRLVGVLAVIAIVVSGIQYIVSQGNPEGVKAAKSRLTHAVVGLILLALMFVILQFLGVT